MILFFAGAHKNGSHFQFYVIEEALRQLSLPYRAIGSDVFHQHDLAGAREIFAEYCDTSEFILCKGHWYKKREQDVIFSENNILVFLIWRHLHDVLISSYFYNINKFNVDYAGFSSFYFSGGGRDILIEQCLYRLAWAGKRAYETSYERLVDDFPGEAARLLAHVGLEGVDLDALQAETSLDRLRTTRGDEKGIFFRDGRTGQYRDFEIAPEVENDIEKLSTMSRISLLRERYLGGLRRIGGKLVS